MTTVNLRGKACQLRGDAPNVGEHAPDFSLVSTKFKEKTLASFSGATKLIYTVSSLDSMVCADTTVELNALAADIPDVQVIVVSADLPFAQQRFCKDHKPQKNVSIVSMMNDRQFAIDYGVLLIEGPLAGLAARAVFVLDSENEVKYTELVSDLTHSPDFNLALKSLSLC